MKTLIIILALTLCACTTQKRTKANLAIDSEPSAMPAESEDTTVTSGSDTPPDGEIDLGLEGSSGPIRVEGALSAEDEDAAIASAKPAEKKKDDKKKTTKDEDEDEDEDEEEEAEE